MQHERKKYIDCLKGIGIFLVVLGHLNPGISVEKWIYSFHMFLFFFLSGYLFKKKDNFLHQVCDTARKCLSPYLFWNLCAILISLLTKEYDLKSATLYLLYWGDKVSWNSPCWYLLVLFFLRLLIQLLPTHVWSYALTVIVGTCLGYINLLNKAPFGLRICPTVIIFFTVGVLIRDAENNSFCNLPPRGKYQWCSIFLMLLTNLLISQYNDRISLYGIYFDRYPLAIFGALCGVLGLYSLVKKVYSFGLCGRILEYGGAYSLNTMCTHYFILRAMSIITNHFWDYDVWHSTGLLKAIICTIIVFLIEIIAVKVLRAFNLPSTHIFKI